MISFILRNINTYAFLLISFSGFSQSAKIDSLLAELKVSTDTVKINVLNDLTFDYWNYDIEKAYAYSQESLQLSKELDYKKGLACANTNIGIYHLHKGDRNKALEFYRIAIKSLDNTVYPKFPSYTLSRIANIYRAQSKFDSSILYYSQALKSSTPNPSKEITSTIYYNTGIAYLEMEKFDSARSNLYRSLLHRKEFGVPYLIASSMNEMGRYFSSIRDYDSAYYYLNAAKSIGDLNNLPEIQIFYSIYTSELELNRGNYTQAIESIKSSLFLLNEFEFLTLKTKSLYLLGSIYTEIGEYDGAIESLLKAEELNKSIGNKKLEAEIDFVLGYVFYYQKIPEKARKVAELAKDLFWEIELKRQVAATNNLLGLIELYEKNYVASEEYFDLGMETYEELNNKKGIASILYNKSFIYLEKNEVDKVLTIQMQALELEKEIDNIPGKIISYNSLGDLLISKKDFDLAEEYLLKARALLVRYPSPSYEEENNLFLSRLYSAKSDYKKAYEFLKLSKQNSDSVFSLSSLDKSLQLSAVHDIEKKEIEIQNLNRDRRSKSMELALQESKLNQQRLIIYLSGLAVLFFALFSFFLVRTIRRLQITQQELIKAEKRASLGILVAGLGHEINNPLNFIKAGMEALKYGRNEWTESEMKYLHAIDEGITRTSEIIKILNQFQREKSVEFQRCDLFKIINESLKEMKDEIPAEKKVIINRQNKGAIIDGNINELIQLFKELLKNSIQSIEEEGEVTVNINANNAYCTVQIKDNGVGIDKENLTLLENPFFTTKDPSKGKGIGLYIVDYILNDHKGRIEFDSVKGEGTKATVSLPKSRKNRRSDWTDLPPTL